MEVKVMIIAAAETFIVKGLEMKLKEIDVRSVYVEPDIKKIEKRFQDINVFLLYTDETVQEYPEVLVFLNDLCAGGKRSIFHIGTKQENQFVTKHILGENLMAWFDRPLDMNAFIRRMQEHEEKMDEESQKKSILIVDDDVSYMLMIQGWLKDDYRVGMANSGIQAITWLAKNKADLILLDYEMPVTSGPQVLEMLKTEAETSLIPVMFLTGKSDRQSIMKVVGLKPVEYLLKTIDKNTLLDKLGKFFKKGGYEA